MLVPIISHMRAGKVLTSMQNAASPGHSLLAHIMLGHQRLNSKFRLIDVRAYIKNDFTHML